MPIVDHFGLIAPFYDRAIHIRNLDRLVGLGAFPVEGAVLDAGGGTGRVSNELRDLAGLRVVLDESAGMLAQAQQKADLRPVRGHVEALPFADETFERVIMVDALHHVANQRSTLSELWRVLKTGGRMIIEEPDIRTFSVKLVALGEKLALMRSHFISPQTIAGMLMQISTEKKKNPPARIEIEREGWNAWIVAQKLG